MSSLLATYASYLPRVVSAAHENAPAALLEPSRRELAAGLLFVDISGFTALTEQLAQRGPAGVEELTRLLNITFGQILELIEQHGGDVVKFAGDALLAIWPADRDLAAATLLATTCALRVQQRMTSFYRLVSGVQLTLRIAVAAGTISLLQIGGVYGRWELLLTGGPLLEIGVAERGAQPGEVVLTPGAWALVAAQASGTALPAERGLTAFVRLLTVDQPPPLPTPASAIRAVPGIENVLRAYIPGAVLSRIVAGQADWLAELRRVTVLFVSLPTLGEHTELHSAHTVVRALQEAVYRFEGSVNKLSLDDKGVTLVAAFGLPPLAHEDDPARGAQAALAIAQALDGLGCPGAVGVTSGRAFCGEIGSPQRREYTMIGAIVNLAARLMQAASPEPHQRALKTAILCDAATAQAARERVSFAALAPVLVKGRSEPVAIFAPQLVLEARTNGAAGAALVGRVRERTALVGALQSLLRAGTQQLVLVEAEAGMGKSRMLEELLDQAALMRLTALTGAADAMEQTKPYHAWRGVFSQLFDLNILSAPEARRGHILNLLEDDADLLDLAPLLNAVLPLELPETARSAPLDGQARADATSALLLRLLRESVQRSPKVIVLEDAHWFDSASWSLALAVARELPRLLLVIALRPLTERRARRGVEPQPPEYEALRDLARPHLLLSALDPDDAVALAARRLGVDALPEPVAALIRDKAQGNPFFSEELAYALRDTGQIEIDGTRCWLTADANLAALDFPETVHGAITSRIDRLSPTQQLTLKVASVIGRVFPVRTLNAVHPVSDGPIRIADDLETLTRLDITPSEPEEPEPAHGFKHAITQDVVYNLMLFAQRRQLHRAVAAWYETTFADDLGRFLPQLGFHWSRAGVVAKALDYLEAAGREALHLSALREARAHFEQALGLLEGTETPDPLRMAQLARLLGETLHYLGEFAEARRRLDQSLTMARAAGSAALLAATLTVLGRLETDIGDYGAAREHLTEGLALAQAAEDGALLALAESHLSNTARRQGHFAEAAERANAALRRFRERGDRGGVARVLSNLGTIAADQDDPATARGHYAEALELFSALSDRFGIAGAQNNLGWALQLLGEYDGARACYEQSLLIARQIGDQRGIAATLTNLGFAHAELEDDVRARVRFDEALSLALRVGALPLVLETLTGLARLLLRSGQLEAAAGLCGFALAHPASNPDVAMQVRLFRARAGAAIPADLFDAALARGAALTLEEALALAE